MEFVWNVSELSLCIHVFLREQGVTLGLDLVGEDKMDAVVTAIKAKGTKERRDVEGEVKQEKNDFEAVPVWGGDPSVVEEPIDINRISSRLLLELL